MSSASGADSGRADAARQERMHAHRYAGMPGTTLARGGRASRRAALGALVLAAAAGIAIAAYVVTGAGRSGHTTALSGRSFATAFDRAWRLQTRPGPPGFLKQLRWAAWIWLRLSLMNTGLRETI